MTDRTLERVAGVALALVLLTGLLASATAVFYGLFHSDGWLLLGGVAGAIGWSWVTLFAFGGEE